MEFEQENNEFYNTESIFEDNETVVSSPQEIDRKRVNKSPEKTGENSVLAKLFEIFFSKVEGFQESRKQKALKRYVENVLKNQEEFFILLNSFGCTLDINGRETTINCKQINLSGKMIQDDNGEFSFDENTMKILQYIVNTILATNSIDSLIDEYEQKGFYPVGNLSKEKAILEGQEVEVLVGTFVNTNGEQRKVYLYNGKQIFPQENQ